ncbi:LOW QUALITY PROTEIN: hypothetical protein V1478_011475 [Vespula squamosa]|uniref:Uncharacterized protein n=1 Tax=Vespula squamosa TaxID=30214 RepID=A0ABD2AEL4_VESSQ
MQQPPRGGTWVGNTCFTLKSYGKQGMSPFFRTRMIGHDRSCLEMSEADGVDGGAFRKRGLTHLQWAEKPEAPEAERHLGTRISRVPVSPWVPECSNLLAVGPGSEILALYKNLTGSKHDRSCLEMSEADGVDGGAFRKRGLTHLQWAEKPETPEAERHLGTRDLE